MVELHAWRKIALKARCVADFISTQGFADLLRERFLIAELVEEWFVEEVLDVFGVVEGCTRGRRLVRSLLRSRLSWVDTCTNVSDERDEG